MNIVPNSWQEAAAAVTVFACLVAFVLATVRHFFVSRAAFDKHTSADKIDAVKANGKLDELDKDIKTCLSNHGDFKAVMETAVSKICSKIEDLRIDMAVMKDRSERYEKRKSIPSRG